MQSLRKASAVKVLKEVMLKKYAFSQIFTSVLGYAV
jgi:hypothetical protein